jgi:Zn-dependent peptidase ImmA (M78 family)
MVKVKFIGNVETLAKGLHFIPGAEYEVTQEVADYMLKTFGNVEVITKQVVIEEKPKQTSKPKEK